MQEDSLGWPSESALLYRISSQLYGFLLQRCVSQTPVRSPMAEVTAERPPTEGAHNEPSHGVASGLA